MRIIFVDIREYLWHRSNQVVPLNVMVGSTLETDSLRYIYIQMIAHQISKNFNINWKLKVTSNAIQKARRPKIKKPGLNRVKMCPNYSFWTIGTSWIRPQMNTRSSFFFFVFVFCFVGLFFVVVVAVVVVVVVVVFHLLLLPVHHCGQIIVHNFWYVPAYQLSKDKLSLLSFCLQRWISWDVVSG